MQQKLSANAIYEVNENIIYFREVKYKQVK